MKSITEIAKQTGISVRTLHHYDAIGLLLPTAVTEAGYRLYDEQALRRLQSILLFRELQFPLEEIKAFLDDPGFDPLAALEDQIQLLQLRKERLEGLIDFARTLQKKGWNPMNFSAFDDHEVKAYEAEAKERWGSTAAYREFEEKKASGADFDERGRKLMELFAHFGPLKELSPSDPAVQEQVAALQAMITQNFYTCTPEILKGLGAMYTADERFRKNIDRAGGEGTAEFVGKAIEVYCK